MKTRLLKIYKRVIFIYSTQLKKKKNTDDDDVDINEEEEENVYSVFLVFYIFHFIVCC